GRGRPSPRCARSGPRRCGRPTGRCRAGPRWWGRKETCPASYRLVRWLSAMRTPGVGPDRRRGVGGWRTRTRVPPPSTAARPRRDRPGVDGAARMNRGAVEALHLRERVGAAGAAHLERGAGVDLPAGAVAAGTGAFGEDAAVVRGHGGLRSEAPQPLHGLR